MTWQWKSCRLICLYKMFAYEPTSMEKCNSSNMCRCTSVCSTKANMLPGIRSFFFSRILRVCVSSRFKFHPFRLLVSLCESNWFFGQNSRSKCMRVGSPTSTCDAPKCLDLCISLIRWSLLAKTSPHGGVFFQVSTGRNLSTMLKSKPRSPVPCTQLLDQSICFDGC